MFLAELYLPSTDVQGHRTASRKAERAAAELARGGADIRYVRSVFVPGDEMCLLLFEADSEQTVALVGATAGLSFDRVVAAADA